MNKIIECGLHSGFPKCCVYFYNYVWMNLYTDSDRKYSFTNLYWAATRKIVSWKKITHIVMWDFDGDIVPVPVDIFGRIPCPLCLLFSRNTKSLPCNCHTGNKCDV